jgi:arylsulfatase A-like enzyme
MERYKLMHFYVDDNWELYDLKTDPEEMHNLYGKKGMEKITTELKAELARLQKEYDVPQELCR